MSNGWYPKLTPDARHVLSGAGELYLDGGPLGIVGWQPTPIDNNRIVFNGGPGVGLQQLWLDSGEVTTLDPRELIELAGGGGVWAGRHAPTDTLVVSDGREIKGAGQPALSARGDLIFRVGDDKIEPSICRTASAWGDGRGRIFWEGLTGPRDGTVGAFEARPVLFDTPDGPWVCTMARDGLNIRHLFDSHGYRVLTGEDRNINAHAVCVDGVLHVVWQDTRGEMFRTAFKLSDPRIDLSAPPPVPDQPKPPEPPPMSMPESLEAEVRAEVAKYPPLPFVDTANYAKVLNAVAWKHRDKGWGLSVKPAGNHVMSPQGVYVAYDILHHKPTDTLWGCFSDAGVNWGLEHPHNDPNRPWLAPIEPSGDNDHSDPGDENDHKPELPDVSADLAVIREQMRELASGLAQVAMTVGNLAGKVDALERKPLPDLVARGRIDLGYGIKTRSVELPVEKK